MPQAVLGAGGGIGPAYVAKAFLPLPRQGGGGIVNVSASTARAPMPLPSGPSGPSGSKAALAALADALRLEAAAWNVPVTVVEPGSTDTGIITEAEKNARAAGVLQRLPAGLPRIGALA